MFARFLRSNKFAFILALFLAVVLWLAVVGGDLFQISPRRGVFEDVLLVYINLDENLEASLEHDTISVTLEGLPEKLQETESDDLVAFVDLEGKTPGNYEMEIKLNPPERLSVISYTPEEIEVSIRE